MDLNLKAVFTLIDRVTAPIRKITDSTKGLGKGLDAVGKTASTMSGRIKAATGALDALDRASDKAKKSGSGLEKVWGQVAGVLSVATGAAVVKGIFDVTAQFEAFEARLVTTEGSSERAKKALSWIQQFAQTTPYELAEVTEAFVRMRAYGIDPLDGSLKTLGNAAAQAQKPLTDAVEAIADAQTFSFERLKEAFQITTEVKGNNVFFRYIKDGKDATVQTQKSATKIRAALIGILDSKTAGAMDKLSKTWNGLWSNLMDVIAGAQLRIGEAGIFDVVKGDLSTFLKWFSDPANKDAVDKWTKEISDTLVELYNVLKTIDWMAVIKAISDVIKMAGDFIQAIGGFKNLIDLGIAAWIASIIAGLTGLVPAFVAVAGALFGVSIAAAPITAVILIIAALAAAAFLVYRNWDKIKDWFGGVWEGVKGVFASVGDWLNNWFVEQPKKWWNALPKWFRDLISGAFKFTPLGMAIDIISKALSGKGDGAAPPPSGGPASPRPAAPASPAYRKPNFGGKGPQPQEMAARVDINVKSDGRVVAAPVKTTGNTRVNLNQGIQRRSTP